jgi:hypothetical protein
MKHNTLTHVAVLVAVLALVSSTPTAAIVVNPTTNLNDLLNALVLPGSGLTVINATLSAQVSGDAMSVGTYTNPQGTYGAYPGIVLSTGNVANYGSGANTSTSKTFSYNVPATAAQEALLDPITSGAYDHFDVTQLDITFQTTTGEVYFFVVFGSEEYPEYVGSQFNDGFGLYLNGVNIAKVGGLPVNISHPDVKSISGTELDGVLAPNDNPLLLFGVSGLDTSAHHTLTFILGDTSDTILDTTVYIAALGGVVNPVIPEPATLWLMASGLMPFVLRRRRTV